MSQAPAIMLEALYGDDFEHQALYFLVRVARSYLDLATADDASVAQRARDVSAAIEILQIAGEEILRCDEIPLSEPWEYGRLEGRRAAAMLSSIERPEPFEGLMTFDVSLHAGDAHDPSTEPKRASYRRQRVTMEISEGVIVNKTRIEFEDLPFGRYEQAALWTDKGRMISAIPLTRHPLVPEGDSAAFEPGAMSLGLL